MSRVVRNSSSKSLGELCVCHWRDTIVLESTLGGDKEPSLSYQKPASMSLFPSEPKRVLHWCRTQGT